jgi:peptide deformylase
MDEILSPETRRLIEDMRETMHDAPGVGLAAPQVGLSLQLIVIEDRPESVRDLTPEQRAERERSGTPFQVLINPVIAHDSQDTVEFFEGCLSVEGFAAIVPRARRVLVEYLDETGERRNLEASGWHARILQHEIDHLNGVLYLDRMYSRSFTSVENLNRQRKDLRIAEVRERIRPGQEPGK